MSIQLIGADGMSSSPATSRLGRGGGGVQRFGGSTGSGGLRRSNGYVSFQLVYKTELELLPQSKLHIKVKIYLQLLYRMINY